VREVPDPVWAFGAPVPERSEQEIMMTITRHEVLTVTSGVLPGEIAKAMLEVPNGAVLQYVDVEADEISSLRVRVRQFGQATFTFRREVSDE
jgi:hypothetical protein